MLRFPVCSSWLLVAFPALCFQDALFFQHICQLILRDRGFCSCFRLSFAPISMWPAGGSAALKTAKTQTPLKGAALSRYPPAQNQYMQEHIIGELILAQIHAGGLLSNSCEYREIIFEEFFSACLREILEGIHFGANTCPSCILTRANTGQNPGEVLCIGFRAWGYVPSPLSLSLSLSPLAR